MPRLFFGLALGLTCLGLGAWPTELRDSDENQTCLKCHGNISPSNSGEGKKPPLLREQFSMDWQMFEIKSDTRPPYPDIKNPTGVIRGTTYYDWKKRSMTEVYREKCIDIFPKGRDYPCQFTSVEDRTYLIRFFNDGKVKSCCLWRQDNFWAPRPDVLFNLSYEKAAKLGNKTAEWFVWDIPLPGPFGYGLFPDEKVPAAFWFPVISGWVQQNFSSFQPEAPGAEVFSLPEACRKDVKICD